jgi:hypothetical protein
MMERDTYIAALAHAIRLGKRPRPGQSMGGKASLDSIDTTTGEVTKGEPVEIEFIVTQELLNAAAAAINDQRATYREPKTSIMALQGKTVPAEVLQFYKRATAPTTASASRPSNSPPPPPANAYSQPPASLGQLPPAGDPRIPKYWNAETSGVLRPAVEAYLRGGPMTIAQIGALKAYLRQWIMSPMWPTFPELVNMRAAVGTIQTQSDLRQWIDKAVEQGCDPL